MKGKSIFSTNLQLAFWFAFLLDAVSSTRLSDLLALRQNVGRCGSLCTTAERQLGVVPWSVRWMFPWSGATARKSIHALPYAASSETEKVHQRFELVFPSSPVESSILLFSVRELFKRVWSVVGCVVLPFSASFKGVWSVVYLSFFFSL